MLTEKENYLMCLRGEQPEWVPMYTIVKARESKVPPSVMVSPYLLTEFRINGGGRDIWGIDYIATYETGNALIPKPGEFILKDITKWRDIVKAPDISHIDWEKMAKEDLERTGGDRTQSALSFNMHVGYFQNLMGLMGFSEGLCAMFEYPEEVSELFDYMCSFYCSVAEHIIDYYNPDILSLMDDTAAWANPFISADMYHELVMPYHYRQAKFGRDRGLPITMHNCGKCEGILDDFIHIGVKQWDPAQTCNDLDAVKKKYGNSLVIAGGWDGRGRLLAPDVTDEELYDSVRQSINRLAPGGGYVFSGGFLGPLDDREVKRKNAVLIKAVDEIGHAFYR